MRWLAAYVAALALAAAPALAGPPYVTDDPVPTDLHHWEIYGFATATRLGSGYDGATGVDLNYGAFRGVQLTATLPLDFGSETRLGGGDVELGAKLRLLHDETAGRSLAIFPRLILPTARGRQAHGKASLLLPVWGQQDFGAWSIFGGGGYTFNPGPGNRNFAQAGLALTRNIDAEFSLGAEVTWRASDALDARSYGAFNVGGTIALGGPLSLLFSAGPGLLHAGDGGRFNGYVALLANF